MTKAEVKTFIEKQANNIVVNSVLNGIEFYGFKNGTGIMLLPTHMYVQNSEGVEARWWYENIKRLERGISVITIHRTSGTKWQIEIG